MPAFEWVHVQLHQQKGMISLSPPTICNSAKNKTIPQPHEPHKSNNRFLYSDVMRFIESLKDKENR
ncbi:hypothetical protein FNJ67_26270 (plasmid) [Escherichia coli]|nr:hypothetical protein FNJ67_26270 [Escherichia coli]